MLLTGIQKPSIQRSDIHWIHCGSQPQDQTAQWGMSCGWSQENKWQRTLVCDTWACEQNLVYSSVYMLATMVNYELFDK